MEYAPIIWIAVAVIFLITEALTAGLTSIWFAGGALAGLLAACLGLGVIGQLALFLAVSLLLLILTRPFVKRISKKKPYRTNAQALIGSTAVVSEAIDNLAQKGQVKIRDLEWLARSEKDEKKIPEGTAVTITGISGVKLIVRMKEE